jgi:hypothetical protein
MIGWNRYQYNGKEGFYLNLVEEYPEDDKNVGGCLQTSISAPYAESEKVKNIVMSLDAPATIVFKGRMQSRAGSVSLVCDEIISITPFVARPPLAGSSPNGDKTPKAST